MTLHRLASIAIASLLLTLCEFMPKSPYSSTRISDTYCMWEQRQWYSPAMQEKFKIFCLNCQDKSCVKAIEANSGSNEVFTGKGIEGMKRLSFIPSLHCSWCPALVVSDHFKGTLARDFRLPFFIIKRMLLVPWFIP